MFCNHLVVFCDKNNVRQLDEVNLMIGVATSSSTISDRVCPVDSCQSPVRMKTYVCRMGMGAIALTG